MVSSRCKMVVKEALKDLNLHIIAVDLGEVDIAETLTLKQLAELKARLLDAGLELMDDKQVVLIEKSKNTIIEKIYHSDELIKVNFPDYLCKTLKCDYTYLAKLFSEVHGTTIEHFIIYHKIERIKKLIVNEKLKITEIAFKMNYSSIAHLSNQFKKMTGLTPSQFKQMNLSSSLLKQNATVNQ